MSVQDDYNEAWNAGYRAGTSTTNLTQQHVDAACLFDMLVTVCARASYFDSPTMDLVYRLIEQRNLETPLREPLRALLETARNID